MKRLLLLILLILPILTLAEDTSFDWYAQETGKMHHQAVLLNLLACNGP